MRIIAFTDIHGAVDRVEGILGKEKNFDVIVVGGDLTTFGTESEAEEAVLRLLAFDRPLFVVAGNMDPVPLEQTFVRLGVSANARGIVMEGVGFFGVSGAPVSPLHTPYEIEEEEILERAEKGWAEVQEARTRIFIPHAPPHNTRLDRLSSGSHVGSTAVRRFIELHQPEAAICGHIHEARGTDAIRRTHIINCGPAGKGCYCILTVDDGVTVELRG